MNQLLSISPTGEIQTIRRKKDCGLDLRDIGGALDVKRVSEISWVASCQAFCIVLKPDHPSSTPLTLSTLKSAGLTYSEICKRLHTTNSHGVVYADYGIPFFRDYEDAVKVEVLYLDKAKALGLTEW